MKKRREQPGSVPAAHLKTVGCEGAARLSPYSIRNQKVIKA